MKKIPPLEIAAPLLFAIVFLLTLIFSRLEPHVEDVDMHYVKKYTGQPGYVLVDTRSEEIYEGTSPMPGLPGGHIPGAISFPIEDLRIAAAAAALAKVDITRKNIVILYCNTGIIAQRFAEALVRDFNFSASNIKNYRGSIRDWCNNPENILLPEDHEHAVHETLEISPRNALGD